MCGLKGGNVGEELASGTGREEGTVLLMGK